MIILQVNNKENVAGQLKLIIFLNLLWMWMSFIFSLAQQEDELSCQADDEVVVVEDLGDGWLRIQKGRDQGYVPETYVQYV